MEWLLALAAFSLLAAWIKITTRQQRNHFEKQVVPQVICEWCKVAPATMSIINHYLDPDTGAVFTEHYMDVCLSCGQENNRLNKMFTETPNGDV